MNDSVPMRPALLRHLSLALLAFAAAAQCRAADETLPTQLRRCATLSDSSARLACYDTLAGSAAVATPAATPAAASPPGAAADASEFGVHNGPLQAKREPLREKKMLASVARVATLPRGEVVLTLDNGQIWVQLEPSNLPVKAGDPIEIDVGALGSYILWSPSTRHASKVTRIN